MLPHKQAKPRVVRRLGTPFRTNTRGRKLDPTPLNEMGESLQLTPLEELADQSIISALQFDHGAVMAIARTAAFLEQNEIAQRTPLHGKIVVTAFFEASTRTRLSFESATHRLAGRVVSVPDGRVTGIRKGESLQDIGEMLNTYGDCVVFRHPETDSIERITQGLSAPIINAGNGAGQHPTQALVDWYAILKWRPELCLQDCPAKRRLHIGIVGRPERMRAVRSFMEMSTALPHAVRRISLVSSGATPISDELWKRIEDAGIEFSLHDRLQDLLGDLDLLYMNSITVSPDGDQYERLDEQFRVTAESPFKPDSVVMHPLARSAELDVSLDETPHNLYFAQAAGAVFIRQALLAGVLSRMGALADAMRGA